MGGDSIMVRWKMVAKERDLEGEEVHDQVEEVRSK